jgi:hypothetical protein
MTRMNVTCRPRADYGAIVLTKISIATLLGLCIVTENELIGLQLNATSKGHIPPCQVSYLGCIKYVADSDTEQQKREECTNVAST